MPVDERASSPPDLAMMLMTGAGPGGIVAAPSANTWHATLAWPATELVAGQRIAVWVWDVDDWTNNDHIARIESRFDGAFPLVLEDATARVECRALDERALAERLALTLARADGALEVMQRAPAPDVAQGQLRPPDPTEARSAITDAATLVGWHALPVRARVAREQALARAWSDGVTQLIDRLGTELPAPGEGLRIAAELVSVAGAVECDPVCVAQELARQHAPHAGSPEGCLLVVDIRPDAAGGFDASAASLVRAQLVARDGSAFNPTWKAVEVGVDARVRVMFLMPMDRRVQPSVSLARVTIYRQPTIALRVR